MGRKIHQGSRAAWAADLAAAMFSISETARRWKTDAVDYLRHLNVCAVAGGKAPENLCASRSGTMIAAVLLQLAKKENLGRAMSGTRGQSLPSGANRSLPGSIATMEWSSADD